MEKKPAPANGDFFGFGNSLTVKGKMLREFCMIGAHFCIAGGILTVADDLLKNDGQKFLEMMESLADKRIQREREAAEELPSDEEEDDDEDYEGSWLSLSFTFKILMLVFR